MLQPRQLTLPLLAAALVTLAAGCSSKPKATPAAAAATAPASAPSAATTVTEPPPPSPVTSPVTDALPASVDELNRRGYLKDVFFDFDRYDVRPDQHAPLTANAAWLAKWPTTRILVEGHCDERGTAAYNMALGERRAQAARDYLQSLGVDPARVEIVSYGKERPFTNGHDETAWAQNRRDHILVTAR